MQDKGSSVLEPEFVTFNEGKRLLGVGDTKLRELCRDGVIDSVKAGKKRLIRLRSVRQFNGAASRELRAAERAAREIGSAA